MKTIGLLGGMSWESTLTYYKLMNKEVKEVLGGSHSAKILMYSFDYFELEKLLNENKFDEISKLLVSKAKLLKDAGADLLVIGANTMHIFANDIKEQVGINIVHMIEETCLQAKKTKSKKVLLLGTKYTMEHNMYPDFFKKQGIEVVIPNEDEKEYIHQAIYNELILGILSQTTKQKFIDIINAHIQRGVDSVILGCTEIPLLIQQEDLSIRVFNTTFIHAKAAVKHALTQ